MAATKNDLRRIHQLQYCDDCRSLGGGRVVHVSLIRFIACFLLCCVGVAHAQTWPPAGPPGWYSRVEIQSTPSVAYSVLGPFATQQAACASQSPFGCAAGPGTCPPTSTASTLQTNTESQCIWRRTMDGYLLGPGLHQVAGEFSCPEGEEQVNGACVPRECPEGQISINGVCQQPGCPAAGTGAGGYSTDSDSIAYTCEAFNGRACTVKIVPTVCVRYEQDGRTYSSCHGDGKFTGGSCFGGGDGGGSTPGGSPGDPDPGPGPDPYPDPSPSNPGGPGAPDQGPSTPVPSPGYPPPNPVPPDPEGDCPEGTSEINGACIQDPEEPDSEGECPTGTVRVGQQCIHPSPPGDGSGGSTGGGGEEGGDCVPGSTLLKCSSMGGLPGGDGINRSTRSLTFAPDSAMATTGTCPASVTIPLLGTTLTVVDMAEACDLISTYVRPIAILLSAFMALGIAAGVLKTET